MPEKTLQELMEEMTANLDKAKTHADKLANPLLNAINEQADELTAIFTDLKLTDPETYEKLKNIVNAETRRNLAIANICEKLKALGKKGAQLATKIGNLSGAGALATLGKALGKRK